MPTQSKITYRCPRCDDPMELENVSDGETVSCDNPLCKQPFQVKLPEVEPEPEVIVPGHSSDDENKNPGSSERDAAFTHESKDEEVLAHYPTPMFRRYPFRFVGYVLLAAIGLVTAFVGMLQSVAAAAVIGAVLLVAAVGTLAYWWWRASKKSVDVTTKSLVLSDGDQTREIHHASITDLHMFQSFLCRQFDTGALLVEWGDGKSQQVYLDAVSNVHDLVRRIRELGQK